MYLHNPFAKESKDVQGGTYEAMLDSFDQLVVRELGAREHFLDSTFKQKYMRHPSSHRNRAFETLSGFLQIAYSQSVIVLIDEYDAPMRVAIENGYANSVWSFIPSLFEMDSHHARPAGSSKRSLALF